MTNPKSKFLLADCMDVLRELPDNYVDLAVVDPPYGIKRFEKSFGATRFKSDVRVANNGIQWDKKPKREYFDELFRVSKNQIIWGANNFSLPQSEYFIIWDKCQTVTNFSSAEYAWTSYKQPARIFKYSIHRHNLTNKIHPTQKPVALYHWLLTNYAKEGDLILDTHVGSASSLIACEELGFNYIACELDPDYYEAAQKRLNEFRSQVRIPFKTSQKTEVEQQTLF